MVAVDVVDVVNGNVFGGDGNRKVRAVAGLGSGSGRVSTFLDAFLCVSQHC